MPTLEEALKIKVPQKTFEFQGNTLTFRLLNSREIEECWEAIRFLDESSKSFALPKQIMARALVEINGNKIAYKSINKEEEEEMTVAEMKQKIIKENIKTFDNVSPKLVTILYNKYQELLTEEDSILEAIKKKEKTVKADTTGKSPSLLV
jgi:hypothetical protein